MSRKELTPRNLKADGACSPGLNWIAPILESGRVPTKNDWELRPNYYLWALGKGYDLPLDILDYCARLLPAEALQYAADHLTPETLEYCARECPRLALAYAAARLSPETLGYCARLRPAETLQYAAAHLTPETRIWCEAQVR